MVEDTGLLKQNVCIIASTQQRQLYQKSFSWAKEIRGNFELESAWIHQKFETHFSVTNELLLLCIHRLKLRSCNIKVSLIPLQVGTVPVHLPS